MIFILKKMANINIRYPFTDSLKGYYFDLTTTENDAIRSDLMLLILTNKGERLYMPDYGTDLKRYLFNPMDSVTQSDIKQNISESVAKYMPNLTIDNVNITVDDTQVNRYNVEIKYVVTDDVFQYRDILIIGL